MLDTIKIGIDQDWEKIYDYNLQDKIIILNDNIDNFVSYVVYPVTSSRRIFSTSSVSSTVGYNPGDVVFIYNE